MTEVEQQLTRLIRHGGPVGVDRFMELCLTHYYGSRDPFGAGGDFITAPEISQMFGELVGLWAAQVWQAMGAPPAVRLVELGPGRGTLMADALRAARIMPGFSAAIEVHLVEISPALRAKQAQTLAATGHQPVWHNAVADALQGAAMSSGILIANEFLDALPLRQFQRRDGAWHERVVGLNEECGLSFGLSPLGAAGLDKAAPEGTILERAEAAAMVMDIVSRHVVAQGGAALFIDYGAVESGHGDTLQAVKNHRFVSVFDDPGEADLTVQVDFAAMSQVARAACAAVHGPVRQASFLEALGLSARAAKLSHNATKEQAIAIQAAASRLMDGSTTGMGELFKVMAVSHPDLKNLPGFPVRGISSHVDSIT